jgi:hypothetical protein
MAPDTAARLQPNSSVSGLTKLVKQSWVPNEPISSTTDAATMTHPYEKRLSGRAGSVFNVPSFRDRSTLERDGYHFLKAQAAESGVSLSSVVRGLVRERMQQAAAEAPYVWDIAGLIVESDFTGKEHDTILYGRPSETHAPAGGGES